MPVLSHLRMSWLSLDIAGGPFLEVRIVRILVTGGAGFIGSNLALRLEELGHDVAVQDDFSSATWRNLVGVCGDVLTCDLWTDFQLIQAQRPFDVIYHQASITDTTVMDQRQMMQ